MAFEFRLPDIGEGLTEAEIAEWLIRSGQEVELDQPMVVIETDKAVTEIPAPTAGVLLRQGAPAGSIVRVGEILAVIGEPGEGWEEPHPEEGRRTAASLPVSPPAKGEQPSGADAPPIVGTLAEAGTIDRAGTNRSNWRRTGAGSRALPLVRKLARELGVDLDSVEGSGRGGEVTREDVERAAAAQAVGRGTATSGEEEHVPLSRLRRTVARNMERSWRDIPHVTTFGEADAARLLHARRALDERRGGPFPIEVLFIKAVLPALQAFPEFNASLEGGDLVLKRSYRIGLAVDTPEGLIVPVVRGADRLDVFALADAILRLSEATKERRARREDLVGATFTISNIGAIGGGYGTPIIPWGTTAILSFGRADERPVVRAGRVEIAPLLPLSLSYDHRVIDGALGRRFLSMVTEYLEEPALLLVP